MQDHAVFDSAGLIDLVIAEVKHGPCRLNGPWTRPVDKNMHRVLYAIGAFDPDRVPIVAYSLYQKGCYVDEKFRVRLFAIGAEKTPSLLPPSAVQLTWDEILQFIYHRFNAYREQKAHHEQWDLEGKWLYWLSIRAAIDGAEFVEVVKTAMKNYAETANRRAA